MYFHPIAVSVAVYIRYFHPIASYKQLRHCREQTDGYIVAVSIQLHAAMNRYIALASVLAVVSRVLGDGPSYPVQGYSAKSCSEEGEFFADKDNVLVPQMCYECERQEPAADVPPPCASDGSYVCYNNGILTYEASKCWCLCHPDWQGNHDCSKPTGYDPVVVVDSDAICVDGKPDDDHCYEAGGCLHGGKCHNQCQGYWCECPDRDIFDYIGPRCEKDDDDYRK
ncbi:hypothetical protein EB796_013840 [Bugula neritina]|uniref:EGF-like domain-containing protein n=1 Tax=Bugula neritina TaxID=10212 RepID=A0A7J7JPM9_BUGNE|nr:hypothetical protein EB796_013840 [Bugula neritina]